MLKKSADVQGKATSKISGQNGMFNDGVLN